MGSEESENQAYSRGFVIEDNVIKGEETPLDLHGAVGELILKNFDENQENIGQIDAETEEQTTFAEMKEKVIRCAIWMKNQGIGPGDVVSICTNNRMDTYIPFFAAFLVGAICNPWHHDVPLRLACYLINLTRPKVVFVCEGAVYTMQIAACIEEVEALFVVFGNYLEVAPLEDILNEQTDDEVESFEPKYIDDLSSSISMIVFSSGSTGYPKAVALSYEMLFRTINGSFSPIKNCSFLSYSSLYWISGILFMLQASIRGNTRIIHSDFDPEETCKVIEKFQITGIFLSPSSTTHFCKSELFKNYELKSLMFIITGGAKLSSELLIGLRKCLPHVSLGQAFGMTEMGGISMMQTRDCKILESVGFIRNSVQAKVINVETGDALGPNEKGELLMKSPTMMIGYYRNPTATREAIDEDGWLHTGDIVYYTEEVEFVVVDRIKEVMKFRGHHVSPTELEKVLLRHPAVMEVGVVPIPHDMDLERPMAFVKKIPGFDVTEEELVEMTSELGELKKLWGGVKFLEELPHTASGKINRKELNEMAKIIYNATKDSQ